MKLRIEASCAEEDLNLALIEMKSIMKATGLVQIEVKVKIKSRTAEQEHAWVMVTNESYPVELVEIYNLKKKIKDLEQKLSLKQ